MEKNVGSQVLFERFSTIGCLTVFLKTDTEGDMNRVVGKGVPVVYNTAWYLQLLFARLGVG